MIVQHWQPKLRILSISFLGPAIKLEDDNLSRYPFNKQCCSMSRFPGVLEKHQLAGCTRSSIIVVGWLLPILRRLRGSRSTGIYQM